MTSTHQRKCFSFLSLPCNLICSLSLSSAKEEKKKKENINEISDPILLEQYTAIADYKKQKNTECSLSAGQVVEVIDKNENGKAFLIQLAPQPSLSLSLLPFLHPLFLCAPLSLSQDGGLSIWMILTKDGYQLRIWSQFMAKMKPTR